MATCLSVLPLRLLSPPPPPPPVLPAPSRLPLRLPSSPLPLPVDIPDGDPPRGDTDGDDRFRGTVMTKWWTLGSMASAASPSPRGPWCGGGGGSLAEEAKEASEEEEDSEDDDEKVKGKDRSTFGKARFFSPGWCFFCFERPRRPERARGQKETRRKRSRRQGKGKVEQTEGFPGGRGEKRGVSEKTERGSAERYQEGGSRWENHGGCQLYVRR